MIERLTGANHKELGFHTYIGAKNPYSVALTLGELLLDNTNPKYRPREILNDVFDHLAAYEDTGLTPERIRELQNAFNILFESERQKQQENEQLRAQVAQYREALIIANHRMPDVGQFCACGKCKTCGADINYVGYEHCIKCARVIIDEALSGTPADYHNPADVAEIELLKIARDNWKKTAEIWDKALKQARDALDDSLQYIDEACIHEALAEIDKAIGGKEDA